MKIRNSLKSLRARHRDNQLVRRKGRVYIINKVQKAVQGAPGLRFVASAARSARNSNRVLSARRGAFGRDRLFALRCSPCRELTPARAA